MRQEATLTVTIPVWLQRLAGIVVGGLAGAVAASYAPDLWNAIGADASDGERDRIEAIGRYEPVPAPDSAEMGRLIARNLIARARDLIARGETRNAERFLSAAERLEPESPMLVETRRLLEAAKARLELAHMAPASGATPAERAARPTASRETTQPSEPSVER